MVGCALLAQVVLLVGGAFIGYELPKPATVDAAPGTGELIGHNLQLGFVYFLLGLATFCIFSTLLVMASSVFNGISIGQFLALGGFESLASEMIHAPFELVGFACFLAAGTGTLRGITRRAGPFKKELRSAVLLNFVGSALLVIGGLIETQ